MNKLTVTSNLSRLSIDDLKTEFSRGLEITIKHLRYLASVWRELENRGEDLSDIRHGLLAYLPMIANDTVDPSIIVNFAGHKTLLSILSVMPLELQRRISEHGYVEMVSGAGEIIEVPVNSLKVSDINKVFDINQRRLRTSEEQLLLANNSNKEKRIKKHVTSIIGFDRQDGCELIVLSGKRAKISKVLAEIARKYPEVAKDLAIVANRF